MTTPSESPFLAALNSRVLIGDGAMGTALQDQDLSLEDFEDLEGCNEILNVSRPDAVLTVHQGHLEAGSDIIETNTFGTNWPNLNEYDIADRIQELSLEGTKIARQAADEYSTPDRPRFVFGSNGPGTKLPTLGHAPFAKLRDAYQLSVLGQLEGGADAILVETCQDLLQAKSAILGAYRAMAEYGRRIPVICHVTVELTGTMLVGSEITAALTALEPLGIDGIGLNCATGPAEMSEHLRALSRQSRIPISVMPNAGLPELGPNGPEYPLQPDELADYCASFITDYGLQLVGGCCGTTNAHVKALAEKCRDLTPGTRDPKPEPGLASVYQAVPFRQDTGFLMIGERSNANGSKAFREAMVEDDYEKCVEIAKAQTREGAHFMDLCIDYVGRDGSADMDRLAHDVSTASTLPVVLDSTEAEVLQTGLEQLGGRSAINSVNYEDGDGPDSRFIKIMTVAKEHGAAVIGLCIDEEGQARTAEWKTRVAFRLISDLTENWGMRVEDIIIDCLTFPISTGQEEVRKDGIETINAIKQLKERYPQVQTTLGLSNISFGLNPAARQVLNSVFLNECTEAGLDSAILNASKILPMSQIDEAQREAALDLVYDRRREERDTPDPLQHFMNLFEGVSASSAKDARAEELAALPLFERLERRIVDGDRNGLEADLDAGMEEKDPLEIINETLLAGMKTVGELFGAGKMQLPFVLASAEVMKASVAYLEPHMEAEDNSGKGKILLATVKGDVHDIGKNLVDIILSNNGYDVVNIGIKQPINAILEAAEENKVDAIGMSGLLVKSTVVMKDNLQEMNDRGVAQKYPVLLGGAALTRSYVENDLGEMFQGDVRYAKDAFEGLRLMDTVMSGDTERTEAEAAKMAERKERRERSQRIQAKREAEAGEDRPAFDPDAISDVARRIEVPQPPFWGTRVVRGIRLKDFAGLLDERATFFGQWGLRGSKGGEGPSYEELVETEGRPRMRYWLDRLQSEGILAHAAVVAGYFPVISEGQDVVVLDEAKPDANELHRFSFPRQKRDRRLCLADFFRTREEATELGSVDVMPMNLVTMGQPIADFANELFAKNSYRDYLEVHGLGVQLTEALAEYWHRRVREELTFADGSSMADQDPADVHEYFKLGYRGARYSLGYGACPNVEDRAKIVELLDPSRIGVELSDEDQLHPEQSTDALVVHHPEAKYFNA
jgi:5-methyltetrahydrofolate--homocysteine methyltransferase